ncbi:hypothetical protein ACHAPT_003544 [Fusarium lateritium]
MGVCPKPSCPSRAEDIVDPDMHGIGVIIAFVVTAALALLVALTAIIRGGIPNYYYMWLDEKLLSKLSPRLTKPPKVTPDNLGYQTFLLSLSDQILLTGIAYTVTMYIQVCGLSVFSFEVGFSLVSICSTVHLATLMVLKPHFLEHRRQAIFRCVLMVLFLVLLYVTAFLEAYTWEYYSDGPFVCACEEPLPGAAVADRVAFVLSISFSYINAILSIKPPRDTFSPSFWTTSVLEFIYSRLDGERMSRLTFIRNGPRHLQASKKVSMP